MTQPSKLEREVSGVTYKINLFENGDALWTIQQKINLTNEVEISAFSSYATQFYKEKNKYVNDFKVLFNQIILNASELAGRPMEGKYYNASVYTLKTISTTFGVIEYSFLWVNFSKKVNEGIFIISDVFEGGFYLYSGDMLEIIVPKNYTTLYIIPTPDFQYDNALIWYGPKSFMQYQPNLEIISRVIRVIANYSLNKENLKIFGQVIPPLENLRISIVLIKPSGELTTFFITTDRNGNFERTFILNESGTWNMKIIYEGNETFYRSEKDFLFNVNVEGNYILYLVILAAFLVLLFIVTIFFIKKLKMKQVEIFGEKDESVVISLLSSHGGVLSQNDIRRMTGFSKSKTSVIIKLLESKGKIKKKKIGRENIIYLVS
ncbi:MAG: hypothetical protein QXS21_03030 [Thermoproteota archaeon]|nr:hypothetical protein [Candidatus Brockarchaeota archaeon]